MACSNLADTKRLTVKNMYLRMTGLRNMCSFYLREAQNHCARFEMKHLSSKHKLSQKHRCENHTTEHVEVMISRLQNHCELKHFTMTTMTTKNTVRTLQQTH